jgi:predicted nucleic acid-binding protein
MKVLVDTSVWSEVLRRKKNIDLTVANTLSKLIKNNEIIIIGPIKQEILSGIKDTKQFENLKTILRAFRGYSIKEIEYEKAVEISNLCRKFGIQGSNADFLICSIAIENNFQIYSLDKDFNNFSNVIPIQLFTP